MMTERYKVPSDELTKVFAECEDLVKRALACSLAYRLDGRAGGCLSVFTVEMGHVPVGQRFIGTILLVKRVKYRGFSEEKGQRLRISGSGHTTSAESRNPGKDMYAGAVDASDKRLTVSFSGFPEALDHAMMVAVIARIDENADDVWAALTLAKMPVVPDWPTAQEWYDALMAVELD